MVISNNLEAEMIITLQVISHIVRLPWEILVKPVTMVLNFFA